MTDIPMDKTETDDRGGSSALLPKPCLICRRRKVKCDKLRPCGNCVRANQSCTYDIDNKGDGPGQEVPVGDSDLRERLARLESMMASMMSGTTTGRDSPEVASQALASHYPIPSVTSSSFLNTAHSYPPNIAAHTQSSSTGLPPGHIVFKEGYGAYFNLDFWPSLISEVEDIRQVFDEDRSEEVAWASHSAAGMSPQVSGSDLTLVQPTIEESNILCKYFFECVNPFVRITHQSLFARELKEYRRGTFPNPAEFEALLFAVYTLTISCLRDEVVEKAFSCSKLVLLARFRNSTQVALAKINFLQSNKVHALSALLHYITFLFRQNYYKEGIALLGSASRLAQNLGAHRDPSHFPFSPWVCEIRRRAWNHLCVLDATALSIYGAESCLPATSDAKPPQNANDCDWHASRFAKPSSVPYSSVGFKDMTFALVHRELADMSRGLATIDCQNYDRKEAMVNEVDERLASTYLSNMDASRSSETIVAALIQVRLASVRLPIRYRRSEGTGSERREVFLSALYLLESSEYHSATYASLNWEWVFQSTVPWLALAIVLTEAPKALDRLEIQRSQLQIQNYFQRFSSTPVASSPMWNMLVKLRQQMEEDRGSADALHSVSSSVGPSPVSGNLHPDLIFADDLMLDFGDGGMVADGVWNDQSVIQSEQDYPWLTSQIQFGNGQFGGFRDEQQQ